jgi:Fur family ferric uptake transcriptional regulator
MAAVAGRPDAETRGVEHPGPDTGPPEGRAALRAGRSSGSPARPHQANWQAHLRARGYRLTPQRQLVLEAVAKLGHATPEAIVTEVRRTADGVNISTVYRTLDLLESLDLVFHAHLGHGAPTYHVTSDSAHVHLVCDECGHIQEIPPDAVADLVERLRDEHGFTVNVDHVALAGRCADCSAAGGVGARTTEG